MSSAIRDWLSSAQAAELRGDKPEAIRFLRLAARFYFEQRMTPRGEQMLRQIRRLEGKPGFDHGRPEGLDDPLPAPTDEELGFGEEQPTNLQAAQFDEGFGFGDELLSEAGGARRGAGQPSRAAPALTREPSRDPPSRDREPATQARTSFDDPPAEVPGAHLSMPLRQASLADPRMDAWCSFCCRPKQEVGQLVAGPAGAFICGACVLLATELLGEDDVDDGADS